MKHMMLLHVLLPVFLSLFVNGIIYANKWNDQKGITDKNTFLPPGWVIGSVWVLIFACLGYAHYLLYKKNKTIGVGSISLVIFFIYAIGYPFLTSGLNRHVRVLNLLALILAFVCALLVLREDNDATKFVIPLLVWTSYVNITDVLN